MTSTGRSGPSSIPSPSGVSREGAVSHPLDPLTASEIRSAAQAVRTSHPELRDPTFSVIVLEEPDKGSVRSGAPDTALPRRARVVVMDRASGGLFDGTVALSSDEPATVAGWADVTGAQPVVRLKDFETAMRVAKADPRFIEALARRGVTDLEAVCVDTLTPGFYESYPSGRRYLWAVPYLSQRHGDNYYARPIENVRALVDVLGEKVLTVADGPVVPIPDADGDYGPEAIGAVRDDLRTIEISQPDGVSFEVSGHEVAWQRWRFHVALHPVQGLVISDVHYRDGDRERPIMYRAALSEMVVPYGDPGDGFFWRSYFDAGEYGIGQTTNSLQLGCDCLGEIYYFDAVLNDEDGEPRDIPQAICMHEEDAGVLWKHTSFVTNTAEVRRSRRLVVSAMSTVGNYDYGFFWSFYQDGSIELEVKLTGIVLTQAVNGDAPPRHARLIAPGLAAPHHQHLFNFRLDMEVDGPENSVYEVDFVGAEVGPDNPYGGAMHAEERLLTSETEARRAVDPLRQRHWKIVNNASRNGVGAPVAYRLMPHEGPTLVAAPESSVGRRAEFARHNLWVTRYAPGEMHAAGDFPNQSEGGDGLGTWTRDNRSLVDTDVVLWHTVGVSHIVRPEDWPVMPVDKIGFALRPAGFFDRNPSLDVPEGAGSNSRNCC